MVRSYILKDIYPNKIVSKKDAKLDDEEVSCIKTLLNMGYRGQDIHYIMNIGRKNTFNNGRIDDVNKLDNIYLKSKDAIDKMLKIQTSYHPITGLNPYKTEHQRLIKAREAMLSAIQNYNTPSIKFKTELFCILANVAWTYLVHEYYERREQRSSIRKTKDNGDIINYTLGGLKDKNNFSITDRGVIDNLSSIIKIRDKAEHNFYPSSLDIDLTPLFQSCCLNFEYYLTEWFGQEISLTSEISLSLQMSGLQKEQVIALETYDLPKEIRTIVERVNTPIIDNSYALKLYFTQETSSRTSSDITKLIAYEDANPDDKVVKQKVIIEKEIVKDPHEKYKITHEKICKQLKKHGIKQHQVNKIINSHGLKHNNTFSYPIMDYKQNQLYQKNKKFPKGVRHEYYPEIIDEIIRLHTIETTGKI